MTKLLMRARCAGVLMVAVMAGAEVSAAATVASLSTGLDAGSLLAEGAIDSRYTLLQSADPALGSTMYVLNPAGGAGAFPYGFWLADSPDSRWLVPYLNGITSTATASAPGTYVVRAQFDLTGFDATSASIVGLWSVDETGVDVLLNGVSTGHSTAPSGFGAFSPLSIAGGFLAGLNTLDFVFSNINQASGNPVGLRVQGSVMADALQAQVSEPVTLAIVGLGGLLLLARRRPHAVSKPA